MAMRYYSKNPVLTTKEYWKTIPVIKKETATGLEFAVIDKEILRDQRISDLDSRFPDYTISKN